MEPWDLHQAGLLGKEQLHSISQLHENFARNLTSAVGGYLRDKFEVALVAVEQLAYRDFLARFSDVTYYGTFLLPPAEASGILHMDLSLAFPIVDLLLGGMGQMPKGTREVTDIEESVLQGIGEVICHELQQVWQPLGLQVAVRVPPVRSASAAHHAAAGEDADPYLRGDHGGFQGNVEYRISLGGIQRAAAQAGNGSGLSAGARGGVNQESMRKRMLHSGVEMELATPPIPVRLTDLLSMQPGGVLPLRRHIDEPVPAGARPRCWLARPVSSGNNSRAAQLLCYVEPPEKEDER